MAITTPLIEESIYTNPLHHANADKNDLNLHHPIGFRSAALGSVMLKDGTGNYSYEQIGTFPAALGYANSSATSPTEVSGDIYLLDDSTPILTIASIDWQSANTVRYTFSGTPDLSIYSTVNNILYNYGSTNSQNDGRFVITSIVSGSYYLEISNPLVSDATYDETTGSSSELPNSSFDGASNGDYVKFDGTNWNRITPNIGAKCYDKTLLQTRTYNGSKWIGDSRVVALACSDETTALTTGTAKATFRNVGKFYITEVRSSLTVAGSTSGLTTIDLNAPTTILITKLSIDFTELTSTTASTPAVISNSIIADDAIVTIDIDAISTGATEAGLKVYLIGFFI